MSGPFRVNLGGEGEVPGVLNQQGPWILDPAWRSASGRVTLAELVRQGHVFVIAANRSLPFASNSVDVVYTNYVPVDKVTWLGPGVQSSEIRRILKTGGRWVKNGRVKLVNP
jgi:hypothetical protein